MIHRLILLARLVHVLGFFQALPISTTQLTEPNMCATIGAPFVTVPEMNAQYKYVRQSHIADEILLFDDISACMKYPNTFDKNVEVTFIRSPQDGSCTPCYRCGNVKSVMLKSLPTTSSSATTTAPAFIAALVVAAATMLFA